MSWDHVKKVSPSYSKIKLPYCGFVIIQIILWIKSQVDYMLVNIAYIQN